MTKYGMKYSSIRYWQKAAEMHVSIRGDRSLFQRMLQWILRPSMIHVARPREIAHATIACAAVCHPSAVRVAISGK